MKYYQRRQLHVQAERWEPDAPAPAWVLNHSLHGFVVSTTVGCLAVHPGDWLIIDEMGEKTVMRDEHFQRMFELSL